MSPEAGYPSSQLSPAGEGLLSLLHSLPGDDLGRCTVVTAAVLTIWQLSGSAFSVSAPSFLLVNGGAPSDEAFKTVVRLMRPMFQPAFLSEPPPATRRPGDIPGFFDGKPEFARTTMLAALATRRKLLAQGLDPATLKRRLGDYPSYWEQGKAELFPALEVNHYDRAFDRDFGVVTGDDDCISLILLSEESRAAFLKDVAKRPARLLAPPGYNNRLDPVTKRVALVGSLPLGEWTKEWLDATLSLPTPFFHLPHFLTGRVVVEHLQDVVMLIRIFTRLHRHHPGAHFTDSNRSPLMEDFPAYERLVRRLCPHLPGDRDFMLRTFIRQLDTVTLHIAVAAGNSAPDSPVTRTLHEDLYRTTLRGIAYGLAALQYHAYGLAVGNHRPAAAAMLAYVRQKENVSRRDLQRKVYTLNAENLGHLLERLAAAGLVTTEGKMVRPTSLEDFLRATPARERFPACRPETTGRLRASA